MSNPIIDNIRHSLGHTAPISSPQGAPLSLRPAIYPSRGPESTDSEMERFLNEIKLLSGVGQRIAPAEIAQALRTLVSECNVRKATLWHTLLFEKLGIQTTLLDLGVDVVSPIASKHEMALCDLGITEADFLLPETGTIVLRSSAERPRGVSLLPRIHLAIVRPEMLRADMHQVFAEAKDSHYLVFITGPSRTADIELTVTLGVHGPKALHAWVLT
jgi:L-lactate dehydrogenase complex protein LldG